MKKILFGAFILFVILSFSACSEDDGPSMNEDYAGTWYGWWDYDYVKVKLTDTTFKSYWWNGSGYETADSGTIEKIGANSLIITIDGYEYYGTYDVSSDGSSLYLYTDVGDFELYNYDYEHG